MFRLRQFFRRYGNRISNGIFFGVVISVLAIRLPGWIHQSEMEGTTIKAFQALDLEGQQVRLPPDDGRPSILIFWATWCGPCTVELKRFTAAVNEGELDGRRVFAVSTQEAVSLVRETAQQRKYPFSVFVDPTGHGASLYEVEGTPTVVHLSAKGEIKWVSSGLSPLGIWRAKKHLTSSN